MPEGRVLEQEAPRDARGAHAYDRAFAIALAWTVATAAISTVMALRLAASEPHGGTAAAPVDTVPSAMRGDRQPEVGRRAAA